MNRLARIPLAALVVSSLATASVAVAQTPGPEALMPEGTIFYMGTSDLDGLIKDTENKALGKILKEQEVKDFLEMPLQQAKDQINGLLAMAKDHPAMANVQIDPEKILKGPYGRLFMGITHFNFPQGKGQAPDIGLVLGVEPKAGGPDVIGLIQTLIYGLAEHEGDTFTKTTEQVGKYSFEKAVADDENAPPICFAKVGSLGLFSLSDHSLRKVLEHANGAQGSLASSQQFQHAAGIVGPGSHGAPTIYFHIGDMMTTMIEGMKNLASSENDASELPMVIKAMELTGFQDMGAMYATSRWEGDVAVARSYVEMPQSPSKLIESFNGFGHPVNKDHLKVIPKDALSFSMFGLDLAPMYDAVMDGIKEVDGDTYNEIQQMMQAFSVEMAGADQDGNPNFDLRRDLLGAMGGEAVFMSLPGPATMFGPGGEYVGWVGCKDKARLDRSFEILLALPGELAGFPLTFKEQEHKGVKLKVLDPASLGPMMMMAGSMSPTYAITDDRFYFSTSARALKKLLDSFENPPEENITHKEDFMRHFKKLPQDVTFSNLSYSDTALNFENTYTMVLGLVPMMMMSGAFNQDDLPFEMSLLPTAEVISQHLFGTVTAYYQKDGAELSEARGPFGAEVGGAVALLVGGIAIGANRMVAESAPRAELTPVVTTEAHDDKGAKAWQDLNDLSAAVTVFAVEFGSPPASLKELAEPKPGYDDGILSRKDIFQDPWGNAYKYVKTGQNSYKVWSTGPNGADENGAGDDLKVEIDRLP